MSNQVFCPSCQKPQYPQIKSGRQVCHDCGVVLPSSVSEACCPVEAIHPGSSSTALDDSSAVPSRPTGAMTLLRSNLRSEEQARPGGWLDTLLPRRPKTPIDQESTRPGRVDPEPSRTTTTTTDQDPSDDATWLDLKPAVPARGPSSTPDPRPAEGSEVVPGSGKKSTIAAVVTVLAFGSIASVGLLQGKSVWSDIMFLATISLLGFSILGTLNRHHARRAWWQGFALFGLGYLALAFGPWSPHPMRVELPTSRLLVDLHAKATASTAPAALPATLEPGTSDAGSPPSNAASTSFVAGDLKQFLVVGHCLFALSAALMGSWIGRWLYRTDLSPA